LAIEKLALNTAAKVIPGVTQITLRYQMGSY